MKTPSRTAFKWRPAGRRGFVFIVFLFLESRGVFQFYALVLMREEDKEARSRLKLQEGVAGRLRGHPRCSVCREAANAAAPRSREMASR